MQSISTNDDLFLIITGRELSDNLLSRNVLYILKHMPKENGFEKVHHAYLNNLEQEASILNSKIWI